jgi:hypothetical protein
MRMRVGSGPESVTIGLAVSGRNIMILILKKTFSIATILLTHHDILLPLSVHITRYKYEKNYNKLKRKQMDACFSQCRMHAF